MPSSAIRHELPIRLQLLHRQKYHTMRIPDWTPALKPQPQDLVDAILKRRGGMLINLDKALLWSEPLARGWNVYLKAVRTPADQPQTA